MKPFIKLNYTSKVDKESSPTLYFVPDFPGIYCDLDLSTEADDCDQYLGTTGLGSEFYLKDGRINKLFIELLPYMDISFDVLEEVINKHQSSQTTDYLISEVNPLNQIYPSEIIFDESLNVVFICFDEKSDLDYIVSNTEVVKVNEKVSLWKDVNSNALFGVFISDFWELTYSQGHVLSRKNLAADRYNSLILIFKQYFDVEVSQDTFERLVEDHLCQKRNSSSVQINLEEQRILKSLQEHRKNLFSIYSI